MTTAERCALDALRTFARTVRAYNALVDQGVSTTSPEYIKAANDMDAAETALLEAADPLLDEPAG